MEIDQAATVLSSRDDKQEIEDKEPSEENGQTLVESKIKETESQVDNEDEELVDNNNLNRVAINRLRTRLTTLYDKPTTSREENFDEIITELFNRYTELTNRRMSSKQRKYFEGLTA